MMLYLKSGETESMSKWKWRLKSAILIFLNMVICPKSLPWLKRMFIRCLDYRYTLWDARTIVFEHEIYYYILLEFKIPHNPFSPPRWMGIWRLTFARKAIPLVLVYLSEEIWLKSYFVLLHYLLHICLGSGGNIVVQNSIVSKILL